MNRTYNGQLLQTQTSSLNLHDPDSGFSFDLQTWEDLKLEYGAESKVANNTDGSIGGYTTDPVKTAGNIKIRREEFHAIQDAVAAQITDRALLQVVFVATVVMGNTIGKTRKDVALVKFNKMGAEWGKSSDPLMIDVPLLVLDYVPNNGKRLLQFPA
jgi:hypothetical protein